MSVITSSDPSLQPERYPRLTLTNWNNKLICRSFTVLHYARPSKFAAGKRFQIWEAKVDRFMGLADVHEVTRVRFSAINEFMARIETGYDLAHCQTMARRFLPQAFELSDDPVLFWILFVKRDDHRRRTHPDQHEAKIIDMSYGKSK